MGILLKNPVTSFHETAFLGILGILGGRRRRPGSKVPGGTRGKGAAAAWRRARAWPVPAPCAPLCGPQRGGGGEDVASWRTWLAVNFGILTGSFVN
eukprot:gene8743-biopygen22657